MPIIRAAEAPHFHLDGFHFLGYTAPSRGATELCTWQLDIDPGAASDAHHLNHEEVFIILQGTLSVTLAGEEIELSKGDTLAVPPYCSFQIANRSDTLARALVCISANFQGTFADGQAVGTPPWAQ